jgi:hypothetical protein
MKPPSVTFVMKPRSHSTTRITAIVTSIGSPFGPVDPRARTTASGGWNRAQTLRYKATRSAPGTHTRTLLVPAGHRSPEAHLDLPQVVV